MSQRQILVTSALPYANGHIHIGHLVEYIQTDIWVRFQKLRGHRVLYVCADDTHGTAIMLRARSEGRSEEDLISEMREAHIRDFSGFGIEFDNYGSTNSEENRRLCEQIWQSIVDAGLVQEKDVSQLYDPVEKTFLADRFVRGTCPKCGATDQPGDNCSKCGTTYSPADLVDPASTLSDATPELRSATHLFIRLERLHGFLEEWTQSGKPLQPEVANYLKGHFLCQPLRDWDVSRPNPYFGFDIPGSANNSWYVWFDAPVGYMASTEQWCAANDSRLDDWWKNDSSEIHHFIGKDITYFHTLFWPGMLKTAGFNLPEKIHIHGFLTVGGEKMSKSRGTFVMASTYLNHLPPQMLRYYYAGKLGNRLDDIDLNLEEFVSRVNSDLVGKIVNLASRTAKFLQEGQLSDSYPDDGGLFAHAAAQADRLAELYEGCSYSAAMREIMLLADRANRYVEECAPWTLNKDPERSDELRDVCTVALNLFRQLVIYLAPVLPELVQQTGELLNKPITRWEDSRIPLTRTPVSRFQHLMKRIDMKQVNSMIEESKDETEAAESLAVEFHPADSWKDPGNALAKEPLSDECTIEDFMKIDLRVARVIEAGHVDGADRLLQLTLSLGGGETRNVFAGIKTAYDPESLVGRIVVCVANLKPRKMKFGLSEGMVCASGAGGKNVFLLSPDEGSEPGQRVH